MCSGEVISKLCTLDHKHYYGLKCYSKIINVTNQTANLKCNKIDYCKFCTQIPWPQCMSSSFIKLCAKVNLCVLCLGNWRTKYNLEPFIVTMPCHLPTVIFLVWTDYCDFHWKVRVKTLWKVSDLLNYMLLAYNKTSLSFHLCNLLYLCVRNVVG